MSVREDTWELHRESGLWVILQLAGQLNKCKYCTCAYPGHFMSTMSITTLHLPCSSHFCIKEQGFLSDNKGAVPTLPGICPHDSFLKVIHGEAIGPGSCVHVLVDDFPLCPTHGGGFNAREIRIPVCPKQNAGERKRKRKGDRKKY